MIKTIELKQCVRIEAHKLGKIIDVVFTEQIGNIKVDEIHTSDYLSDHASMLWTILTFSLLWAISVSFLISFVTTTGDYDCLIDYCKTQYAVAW